MCGVVAVSLKRQVRHINADELVDDLVRQVAHRGPDGSGVAGRARTALGMSRLRVRSAPADPVPFVDREQGTVYAFNGEVYRDGDVVPVGGLDEARRAYAASHRPDPVDGMYALVCGLSDDTLRLARDPLGIKPLYLREGPEGVAVASELPPLVRAFGRPPIRAEAFAQFLLTGRRVVDGGTFFEGIRPVAPGETLAIRDGAVVRSEVSVPRAPVGTRPPEPEQLWAAVEEAVDRTCLADRRLGLALSGGLDSTILAAVLARRGVRDLRTVSVVPAETGDGVRALADLGLAADGVIGSWRHAWTPFGPADLLDGLPEAVRVYGEPVAMTSVPMYAALARLAQANDITVLLVGEGADELFGGYHRYRAGYGGTLTDPLDFYVSEQRRQLVTELLGESARTSALEALRAALTRAEDAVRQRSDPANPADVVREFEYEHSLEPLLRRTDHLLMAEGVEGRTPFLHADVPALAQRCPTASLVRDAETKVVLRDAFAPWLPQRYRREPKRPFRAPVTRWFSGPLLPRIDRRLADGTDLLWHHVGVRPAGLATLRARLARGEALAFTVAFALLATLDWLGWLDQGAVGAAGGDRC